jgi:hypothetical protein
MSNTIETLGDLAFLYPFPGSIIIQDRSLVIKYASNIFEQGIFDRCLVVWVDDLYCTFTPKSPRKAIVTQKSDASAIRGPVLACANTGIAQDYSAPQPDE